MNKLKLFLIALVSSALFLTSCEEELSSEKAITQFEIKDFEGTITIVDNRFDITLPYGTILNELTPVGEVSLGAKISPAFGYPVDFSQPVIFTVTAEDGSQTTYIVTITTELSSEANITSFKMLNESIEASIEGEIIRIYVPYGTDYTKITASGELSSDASVSPNFGTVVDFTNNVTYTVTAQDGTIKTYTVMLFVESFVDFEEFSLDPNSHWTDSDNEGKFTSNNVDFSAFYMDYLGNAIWGAFIYSNQTDNQTVGIDNQYVTYANSGANGSENFGLAYTVGASTDITFEKLTTITEAWFTNNVYACLSMKNGDIFTKKFGGETGNDEDWFKVVVEGFDENDVSVGTIDVFLADFRFSDNSEDYILEDWAKFDLSELGAVKKLHFSLASTDNGDWGMNTPAYFCIDDIKGIVQK